jgi:elongation factor G
MAPAPLSLAITPKTPADRQKLARGLDALAAEHGGLEVRPAADRDCTVIGATSEAHLEEIVDRLHREFEVEARLGAPTVTYLETVTRPAEGSARHVRMAHGHGEYAHVALRLRPADPGSGFAFEDTTTGGAIPKRFMTAVEAGIRQAMEEGILRGHPIVDVRVEVHDGSYHDTDSTAEAFRAAAAMAFQAAARKAQPLVLEPIMQVVARAENRHVKTVVEDLRVRRGAIDGRTREPGHEVITARVPLSELFGFEWHLRAETRGHVSCAIRFAHYRPVVPGPAGDDDYTSRVGAPRRPAPGLGGSAASVPEPGDSNPEG